MRPLRLELEGFTCYRDPQPALDLSPMSLFAIAGPTGAGKSTILDAMLYALYGMVPRMSGKQGLGEFVSHGRDVLSVCLDFALNGRQYRLTRRAKKTRRNTIQSDALFSELTDQGERNIAGGATAVDDAVIGLLGLDFGAFTQTVILPQNQFARFLQSKPREQRQIIQHLLRHEVYVRMREEAERRKGLLERDLRGKDEQLAHLGGATPEALTALEDEHQRAQLAVTDAQKERTAAAEVLQDLRTRRNLTVELKKARTSAKDLEARAPGIATKRQELERATAAEAVRPVREAVDAAARRTQKCAADVSEAQGALQSSEKTSAAAQKALATAEEAGRSIPELRAKVQKLDEIRGDIDRRPQLSSDLERATRGLAAAERRVASAQNDRETVSRKAAAAKAKADKAQADLQAIRYDAALHHRLDALRDDGAQAKALAREIDGLTAKLQRSAKQTDEAKRKLEAANEAHQIARAAHKAARALRQAAEAELREGHRQEAASSLRQDLDAGAECPVCEQIVPKKPRRLAQPRLEALEQRVGQATEKEEELADDVKLAGQEVTKAEARVADLSARREEIEADLSARRKDQQKKLRGIARAMQVPGEMQDADVLAAFDAAFDDLRRLASLREERQAASGEAQDDSRKAELAAARADAEYREAVQQHTSLAETQRRLRRELDEVVARIAKVTSASDPLKERESLSQEIEKLHGRLESAREALQRASEAVAAARAHMDAVTGAEATQKEELARLKGDLEQALAARGFRTVKEPSSAARTRDQMAAIDKEIRSFEQLEASARDRLAELEPRIAGREVDEASVTAAAARDTAAGRAAEQAVATAARLGEQVQKLRQDVERAKTLALERASISRILAHTSEMASDLRNDAFQEYLLEEAFKALVAGASVRLREMSRRYTMEWRSGEFFVLDHDNAGERRGAETLSGGETFMASLCLALQLSDEVLHASGAIRMDSLFIDEGFGTLDDGSLSEVTDALENLRQDGDRVIGVISHRPELTDRLPGCIRVEKGIGESRWLVERVG